MWWGIWGVGRSEVLFCATGFGIRYGIGVLWSYTAGIGTGWDGIPTRIIIADAILERSQLACYCTNAAQNTSNKNITIQRGEYYNQVQPKFSQRCTSKNTPLSTPSILKPTNIPPKHPIHHPINRHKHLIPPTNRPRQIRAPPNNPRYIALQPSAPFAAALEQGVPVANVG